MWYHLELLQIAVMGLYAAWETKGIEDLLLHCSRYIHCACDSFSLLEAPSSNYWHRAFSATGRAKKDVPEEAS